MCCTYNVSSIGFSLAGPNKVEARKSFLFPCIENKEHLVDFIITLFLLSQMGTGCLRPTTVAIFVV